MSSDDKADDKMGKKSGERMMMRMRSWMRWTLCVILAQGVDGRMDETRVAGIVETPSHRRDLTRLPRGERPECSIQLGALPCWPAGLHRYRWGAWVRTEFNILK